MREQMTEHAAFGRRVVLYRFWSREYIKWDKSDIYYETGVAMSWAICATSMAES